MDDNTTYYTNLITRYFSGEIAGDELSMLSGWLKDSPEHEELFRQLSETWKIVEKQKINSLVNIDLELSSLKAKMKNPVKVIPLNRNRNRIKSLLQHTWKVAAVVLVLITSSLLLYLYLSKPKDIVILARAKNLEQLLPDGSVVYLHAGSQIKYPVKFASDKRNVELEGKAYFEVAHNKTKPFIVASGDARVEVLGTRFNVNTHKSGESMEVVLTSGKVSLYFKGKSKDNVLLMPGEKAEVFTEKKVISKTLNNDPNYMAWKTRVIIFNDESLSEVVKTLQDVYQTPVRLVNPQLTQCRVTASFNDQSLQSVLEVLKETLGLQVKQNGNIIELEGNACE
jgi:transmembrane sensor